MESRAAFLGSSPFLRFALVRAPSAVVPQLDGYLRLPITRERAYSYCVCKFMSFLINQEISVVFNVAQSGRRNTRLSLFKLFLQSVFGKDDDVIHTVYLCSQ